MVGWEAFPEPRKPRPSYHWVLGTIPSLSLSHPGKQRCCHENPELALGPSPLQAVPPSAVPFSSTDRPNGTHPTKSTSPRKSPIHASFPLWHFWTWMLPMFVVFHEQQRHSTSALRLLSFPVSGISLGSLQKIDFQGQIILGNTKWFLCFGTCQNL